MALPCVARGTPVIFVESSKIFQGNLRTAGLTELFHVLDFKDLDNEAVNNWIEKFDYEHPPPNPKLGKPFLLF